MPINKTIYECEFCFEEYDSIKGCKSHEEYCDKNPKNLIDDDDDNNLLELCECSI